MSATKTTSQRVDEIFAKFCRIVESNHIRDIYPIAKHSVTHKDLAKIRLDEIGNFFYVDLKELRRWPNFDSEYVFTKFCNYLHRWGIDLDDEVVHYIFSYYSDCNLLRCLIHCGFKLDYNKCGVYFERRYFLQRCYEVSWNKCLIESDVNENEVYKQISQFGLRQLNVRIRSGNDYHYSFAIENTAIFHVLIEM